MLRWCRSTSASKHSGRPARVPATSDSSSTPPALARGTARCCSGGLLLGRVVLLVAVMLLVVLLVLLLVRSMMGVMLVMGCGHHRLHQGARQHQGSQGGGEQVTNPHVEGLLSSIRGDAPMRRKVKRVSAAAGRAPARGSATPGDVGESTPAPPGRPGA